MHTNKTLFVKIVTKMRLPEPNEEFHEKVLTVLTREDGTIEGRVQDLLDLYNWSGGRDTREYFSIAFEALIVGHHHIAHLLLREIDTQLRRETDNHKGTLPIPIVTGVLRAVNRCDDTNRAFKQEHPVGIGSILRHFATSRGSSSEFVSDALVIQFSSAFNEYFNCPDRDARYSRLVGVSDQLRDVTVSTGARRVMDEVARCFMHRAGLRAALNAFSDDFRLQASAKFGVGIPGQVVG